MSFLQNSARWRQSTCKWLVKRKLKGKRKSKAQGRSESRKRSQCQKPFDTQSENAARGRVRRCLGEAWTRAGTKTVARPASTFPSSTSSSPLLPPSSPLSLPLAFCRLAFGFVAKVLKAFAAIDSRLATLSPSQSLSSPSLGIFLEFHNNYNFVCVFACLGGRRRRCTCVGCWQKVVSADKKLNTLYGIFVAACVAGTVYR